METQRESGVSHQMFRNPVSADLPSSILDICGATEEKDKLAGIFALVAEKKSHNLPPGLPGETSESYFHRLFPQQDIRYQRGLKEIMECFPEFKSGIKQYGIEKCAVPDEIYVCGECDSPIGTCQPGECSVYAHKVC